MKTPESAIFVRHVQYCLAQCCHYVDGSAVSQAQYEDILNQLRSPLRQISSNQMVFQEVLIPCQNIGLHTAVERQIGYFLGEPQDRADAFTIEFSGPLNVYDANSRKFLRIATEQDVKKWNDAVEAGMRERHELEKNWPREDHEDVAKGLRRYS